MAVANRKSLLAVEAESTEGTLVLPTGATSYIELTPDFDLAPNFQNLENQYIKNSIGMSKPIRGREEPSANYGGYLRHSGTEGTAPNYAPLLKTLLGTQTTQSTERTLTSGSTTTQLELASGGSDYARGRFVLIKDNSNGYSIRPVLSVSSNSLTLGFKVGTAPATGVTLGKHCMFEPASESHQTISLSHYEGNGGAKRHLAGGRISEGTFEFVAGQLITCKFKIDGIWYGENSILVTTSNQEIDFEDQDGVLNAKLPVGWYKDPHELAAAAAQVMNAANANRTVTCTYDDTDGKYDWTCTGTTFKLLWNTGANTAESAATLFGDTTAADRTGATSYTSTNAITLTAPHTPTFDATDPVAAKAMDLIVGDQSDYVSLKASKATLTISDEIQKIEDMTAASGISGSIVMGRKVTLAVSALYEKYDVELFKRYRSATATGAFMAFGTKTQSNWNAGKCGGVWLPDCTVSSWKPTVVGGLRGFDATFEGYVEDSDGEVYVGFV